MPPPVSQFRIGERWDAFEGDIGEVEGQRGEEAGDAVATELSNKEQACWEFSKEGSASSRQYVDICSSSLSRASVKTGVRLHLCGLLGGDKDCFFCGSSWLGEDDEKIDLAQERTPPSLSLSVLVLFKELRRANRIRGRELERIFRDRQDGDGGGCCCCLFIFKERVLFTCTRLVSSD